MVELDDLKEADVKEHAEREAEAEAPQHPSLPLTAQPVPDVPSVPSFGALPPGLASLPNLRLA